MQATFILDLILLGLFAIYLVFCQLQWRKIRTAIQKLLMDKSLLADIGKQSRWLTWFICTLNSGMVYFVYTRIEVMWKLSLLWVPTSWVLTGIFMLWSVFILLRASLAYPAYLLLKLRGL